MLLSGLMSLALAAEPPCAEIEPPLPLEEAQAQALGELRALWVLDAEERLSRSQSDKHLIEQVKALMTGLEAVNAVAQQAAEGPAAQAQAEVLQALADAHVAQALLRSPTPWYLTEEQSEIYREALEDKAYPSTQAAADHWRSALTLQFAQQDHGPATEQMQACLLASRPDLAVTLPGPLPPTTPLVQPAFAALRLGDPDGAVRLLEQAQRAGPPHPHVSLGFAYVAELRGQEEEALTHYQRAVELAPTDPTLGLQLARVYLERGEPEAAEPVLQRILGFATGAQAEEARRMLEQAQSTRSRRRRGHRRR